MNDAVIARSGFKWHAAGQRAGNALRYGLARPDPNPCTNAAGLRQPAPHPQVQDLHQSGGTPHPARLQRPHTSRPLLRPSSSSRSACGAAIQGPLAPSLRPLDCHGAARLAMTACLQKGQSKCQLVSVGRMAAAKATSSMRCAEPWARATPRRGDGGHDLRRHRHSARPAPG